MIAVGAMQSMQAGRASQTLKRQRQKRWGPTPRRSAAGRAKREPATWRFGVDQAVHRFDARSKAFP
jgi:hypothetical protein